MGRREKEHKSKHKYRSEIATGISLVEVLVAVAVASIVGFALYSLLEHQQHSYAVQDDVSEMQQNLRAAVEKISRELTMAGFGKATPADSTINGEDISSWYNGGTAPPWTPVGAGTAHRLDFLCCPTTPDGRIASMTSTSITLRDAPGTSFNTYDAAGGTGHDRCDITIGGTQQARITAITGNILTIKALAPATTLVPSAAGTEVYVLRHTSYFTTIENNVPVLKVNEHRGAGSQQVCQYVSDINAILSGNKVTVTLTGRSRNRDTLTGNYVSSTLSADIVLRNP